MTAIGDIIFAIVWFGALIFGIRLMSNGWSLMTQEKREEKWERKKPDFDFKKAIEQSTHPEVQNLEPEDQFMVVNFVNEDPPVDKDKFKLDSPELHNLGESLHQSLKDRIEELKEEDKDDDEDGDDGGAGVVLSR